MRPFIEQVGFGDKQENFFRKNGLAYSSKENYLLILGAIMAKEHVMAEKILKVSLSELETVRLVCKRENCGGVAEIPTARLEALVGSVQCPSCGQGFAIPQIG